MYDFKTIIIFGFRGFVKLILTPRTCKWLTTIYDSTFAWILVWKDSLFHVDSLLWLLF